MNKKQGCQKRVLGPVVNLEEHVRPDWWRSIFNSIYLKTDADVVDDQSIKLGEILLGELISKYNEQKKGGIR